MSTEGAWEEWIRFFCRAVLEDCTDGIRRAESLHALRQRYVETVQKDSRTRRTAELIGYLFTNPAVNVRVAKNVLGITQPATQMHIDRLVEHGILSEVTGSSWGRIWVAEEIASLVESD